MAINHRAEAERHASKGAFTDDRGIPSNPRATDFYFRLAQIHATLAAGETASADIASYRHAIHTYRFALIRQIAEGLALSEGDEAHQHARGLAKYLDSVGLNVDDAVDAYIEEHSGMAPRDAWKPPTIRRADWEAAGPPGGDPWAGQNAAQPGSGTPTP